MSANNEAQKLNDEDIATSKSLDLEADELAVFHSFDEVFPDIAASIKKETSMRERLHRNREMLQNAKNKGLQNRVKEAVRKTARLCKII